MGKHVDRHAFNRDQVEEIYLMDMDFHKSHRPIPTIEAYCSRQARILELALKSVVIDEHEVSLAFLQMLLQIDSGLYRLAINPDEKVNVFYKDEAFEFTGKIFANYITPDTLSRGIELGIILRQPEILKFLARVPLELTTRYRQIKPSDFLLLKADFQQRLFRKEDYGPALLAAYKATDPALYPDDQLWQSFLVDLNAPQLDVYAALLKNDPTLFNERLYDALKLHHDFWDKDSGFNPGDGPRRNYETGFISIPLTAVTAMAFDRGWKIETESDYIPKFLIEGDFRREVLLF